MCLVPWMEKCVADWNENVTQFSDHVIHALTVAFSFPRRDVYLPVFFLRLVAFLALGQRPQHLYKRPLPLFPLSH